MKQHQSILFLPLPSSKVSRSAQLFERFYNLLISLYTPLNSLNKSICQSWNQLGPHCPKMKQLWCEHNLVHVIFLLSFMVRASRQCIGFGGLTTGTMDQNEVKTRE